jgi:hypothetical protein
VEEGSSVHDPLLVLARVFYTWNQYSLSGTNLNVPIWTDTKLPSQEVAFGKIQTPSDRVVLAQAMSGKHVLQREAGLCGTHAYFCHNSATMQVHLSK